MPVAWLSISGSHRVSQYHNFSKERLFFCKTLSCHIEGLSRSAFWLHEVFVAHFNWKAAVGQYRGKNVHFPPKIVALSEFIMGNATVTLRTCADVPAELPGVCSLCCTSPAQKKRLFSVSPCL